MSAPTAPARRATAPPKELNADQAAYGDWLATPAHFREEGAPRTKALYAAATGWDRTTLWAWEQLLEFNAYCQKAREEFRLRNQDKVDQALLLSAQIVGREGQADRKLFYQLTHQLVERTATTTDVTVHSGAVVANERAAIESAEDLFTSDEVFALLDEADRFSADMVNAATLADADASGQPARDAVEDPSAFDGLL